MSNQTTSHSSGGGFFALLGVLFIGLKLTGQIDWSWWLVLAPLYAGPALILVIFGLIVLFAAAKK